MTEMKNTRRFAQKVETYEQKTRIVSPLVSAIINMEEMAEHNTEYLSTVEINKLNTLITKMNELNDSIVQRMNKDIESYQNRDHKKELIKKLRSLSVEELEAFEAFKNQKNQEE